jgi:hypothetical protein
MSRVSLTLAVIALVAARLPAQAPPPVCTAQAFRNFDFWVGEWEVSDTGGHVIGKSTIERSSAGCAILEHWQPARGVDGNSINWYSAADSTWHQQWVGGGGWIARFAGSYRNGMIALTETESSLPPAAGRNRMSYMLLPDGRVKQWQDNTTDGGKTWKTQFVGYYRKTG